MTFIVGYRLWHHALVAHLSHLMRARLYFLDPTLIPLSPDYPASLLIEEIVWHLRHPEVLREKGFF